ncbi:MAG: MFS transporter [Pseudoclavibacter sp.]
MSRVLDQLRTHAGMAFRSLFVHNYRLWFAGALVSNVGLWMARISQDWVVLTVLSHNSGLAVGITTGLQFAPQLLLAPFAGVLVDRFPKRRLLIWTQIGMSFLVLIQGIVVLGGFATLAHMYILAFCLGMVSAVDSPARQVFVTEMVGPGDVANAVSLNSVSFNSARLVGPALGGIVIQAVGPGWSFLLNCLTYAAMLSALGLMDSTELRPARRASRAQSGVRQAFAFLRREPSILVVTCVVCLVSMFALNFPVTIALMAVVTYHRGAGDYGLLSSAIAVGALAGALISAQVRMPRFRTVIVSAFGLGVAMVCAALSPTYVVFAVCLMVCGLFMMRLITTANAYVQLNTPGMLRGRVMSIYLAGFLGGAPIGSPLIGWLGSRFSPPVAILAGAASCLIAAGCVLIWMLWTGRVQVSGVPALVLPHRSHVGRLEQVTHPETGPLVLPDLGDDEELRAEFRKERDGRPGAPSWGPKSRGSASPDADGPGTGRPGSDEPGEGQDSASQDRSNT